MSTIRWPTLVGLIAATACQQTTAPQVSQLTVVARTIGVSLDPDGYIVTVAGLGGPPELRRIGTTATTSFSRIPGVYTVSLTDVSPNCTISGATSRTDSVRGDTVVTEELDLSCAHANGRINAYTDLPASAGSGPFPVTLDSSITRSLGAKDSTPFTDLADGAHILMIAGIHPRSACEASTNSAVISVSGGGSAAFTFSSGGDRCPDQP